MVPVPGSTGGTPERETRWTSGAAHSTRIPPSSPRSDASGCTSVRQDSLGPRGKPPFAVCMAAWLQAPVLTCVILLVFFFYVILLHASGNVMRRYVSLSPPRSRLVYDSIFSCCSWC